MKDVIFETAFATLTSALHFGGEMERDDMEEACDGDHETTANETRKLPFPVLKNFLHI